MEKFEFEVIVSQNDNQESPKIVESELFYVHTDYVDEVGDCVSLKRGDMVEIHEKHASGWWLGRRLKDDFILTWMPSAFLQKSIEIAFSIDG